ncbi:hypothetical protein [Streptomyces sp. NPDC002588]|uniref:hypothetical protein n=1 Tax=Streptomyces sp. NPDC002588 TaxID=3154419 RepID=UPI00332B826D
MRHITGRAVRTVLGTVAALATLALPLALNLPTEHSHDGSRHVVAEVVGTDTGSWVWDSQD